MGYRDSHSFNSCCCNGEYSRITFEWFCCLNGESDGMYSPHFSSFAFHHVLHATFMFFLHFSSYIFFLCSSHILSPLTGYLGEYSIQCLGIFKYGEQTGL